MGGTRFIGKSLVKKLCQKGYELTLFTRGNNPIPNDVDHVIGDRKNNQDLSKLSSRKFDVIIDTSGRNLSDTESVLNQTGIPNYRYVYISSAGVYKKSEIIPVDEDFLIDHDSRHIGKAITEKWLVNNKIPFTSFRPTYIYGPGNYNPIESWFFDRLIHRRPIPVPGNGETITQLGHVSDLAKAISMSLASEKANNKIYNCSGKKGITFKGLIDLAAITVGINNQDIEIMSFDPSKLDPKARKCFPLRIEHFFTDTSSLEKDLNWIEDYSLNDGFKDSFENDYLLEKSREPDFTSDYKLFSL